MNYANILRIYPLYWEFIRFYLGGETDPKSKGLLLSSEPPRLCTGVPNGDTKELLYYIMHVIMWFKRNLESFKTASKSSLGIFKDSNIHRDRQREATLFYIMLWLWWFNKTIWRRWADHPSVCYFTAFNKFWPGYRLEYSRIFLSILGQMRSMSSVGCPCSLIWTVGAIQSIYIIILSLQYLSFFSCLLWILSHVWACLFWIRPLLRWLLIISWRVEIDQSVP
jgi:hypothetical protein